jgi:hypothetical protein
VIGVIQDFRRAQQRFRRDAAPVQTDAAQMLALDNRGLQAQLRRADRGHIPARPGTDDDDIKAVFRHGALRRASG